MFTEMQIVTGTPSFRVLQGYPSISPLSESKNFNQGGDSQNFLGKFVRFFYIFKVLLRSSYS